MRDSALPGNGYIQELIEGNEVRLLENYRKGRASFLYLSNLLRQSNKVKDTRLGVKEKLAIFLIISCTGCGVRQVQERFQRGGSTISRVSRKL